MTVATPPFGGERSGTEEGTRPGESERGSRGLRGIAGRVQGEDGAARQGAACHAERARAPGTRPVRLAGGGDDWHWASWLGRHSARPVSGPGKGFLSLSYFFLFSISDICFNLVFEPN